MKPFYIIVIIFLLVGFLSCNQQNDVPIMKKGVFLVSYPRDYSKNTDTVYLKMLDIKQYCGITDFSTIQLVSMNNHKQVPFKLCDSNGDNEPDLLAFSLNINQKEPLRPFAFFTTHKIEKQVVENMNFYHNGVDITYLQNVSQDNEDSLYWSKKVAHTFMELYPEACSLEIFSPLEWTYTNGFFTNSLCELFEITHDTTYITYAKNWIDCFVDENGTIENYDQQKYRLDDILPGRTLLYLQKYFPEKRYKVAADNFIYHLKNQPRNSDGGYWHKTVYPHQMWLDGIYMGDVYAAQYAQLNENPELLNDAIHQVKLIYRHTRDTVTGLMYHGYDETKNDVWANPLTGTSPEFWGRGMGWYMMALVDLLDYLPTDHPERADIITILNETSQALAKVQDEKNHLWYQVLDKGAQSDNWIETSCSAMFAYAFTKGAIMGYLPKTYLQNANDAFNSLINDYVYFDSQGRFYLTETVHVGTLNFKTSDGSYNYYINVDRRINDFKGVAAFLYLAMALEK